MTSIWDNIINNQNLPRENFFTLSEGLLFSSLIADITVALFCLAIPLALFLIVRKKKYLQFRILFLLYGLLFLFSGLAKLASVFSEWAPISEVEAALKISTALLTVPTIFILIKLIPHIHIMPNMKEWGAVNKELDQKNEKLKEQDHIIEQIREFEFLAQTVPQIVWTANNSGEILFFNDLWYQHTGQTENEAIPTGWMDTIHPEDLEPFLMTFTESITNSVALLFEHRVRGIDGEYRWFKAKALPLKDPKGEVLKWFGTCTDIHDYKLSINALKESRDDFSNLANSIPQIIWTAKPNGDLDYYNNFWIEYSGMTLDQTVGWGWKEVTHPDDLNSITEIWSESVRLGRSHQAEFRFKRASDSTFRWQLERAIPVKDSEGNVTKWYGTCTDIDDFKKAQEVAKSSQDRLETVINNSPIVLWSIDQDGIYTFAEGDGLKKLGLTSEALVGRSHFEIFKERPDLVENVKRALRGEAFSYSIGFEGRVLDTYYSPLKDEKGGMQGMVAVSVDNTSVKKAETASQFKSRFLATMSHEIRTPLNAIIGFSEILKRKNTSDHTREEYLNHILSSGKILLKLIGDILDLSKIEEGKMELHYEKFNFKEVLISSLTPYKYKAGEKGLGFKILFDENIPAVVYGDSHRINQVLINLIGNSIKFTQEGNISVTFECEGNSGDTTFVKISVADTGMGVPEDKQQQIFESFTQADSTIVREFGGSGLGLNISQQIVSLLGGEIQLISPSNLNKKLGGSGSTFTFTLALNVVSLDETEILENKTERIKGNGEQKRLLVAEDNDANQVVIRVLLEDEGYLVDIANNGEEVLEMLKAEIYSAILMDMQMPKMDGLTATKIIRSMNNNIPVIGLTANVYKEDINKCINSGMNDFVAKPINSDVLFEKIRKNLVN